MFFRRIEEEDISLVSEMMKSLLKDSRYKDFFGYDIPEELIKTFITDKNKDAWFFLNDEGEPIGFAGVEAVTAYTDFTIGRIAAIYIKPEERKKGYMSKFLDNFENWCKMIGCKYINLGVSTGADLTSRGYKQYEVMYMKEIN